MSLARPSMPCFNECAIDPHYHSLDWFGDNTRMIDFIADFLFNAFPDSAFGCVTSGFRQRLVQERSGLR